MTIATLREALLAGTTSPERLVDDALARLVAAGDGAVVIATLPEELAAARARAVARTDPASPLWGIPFVVKDNIDVAGMPTTAGCPAYAFVPSRSAPVVRRLEAAGAIAIAKTNMDQFATGLVGTRSPYGTPRNPVAAGRVPGGSSSGSAVAVATGSVAFALGTDTAGSGRVPAAFTGIVGSKPTRGWLSTRGVVPAVRTLDCVSVFATTVEDAWAVVTAAAAFDPLDIFSRPQPGSGAARSGAGGSGGARDCPRIGVASALPSGIQTALGGIGSVVEADPEPLLAAGRLLYDGPWLLERFAAVGRFIDQHPGQVDPCVASIILAARRVSAADVASCTYRLAALRRRMDAVWAQVDVLVVPTVSRHPTTEEVAADPIGVNAELGRWTAGSNLLDLCAVAVPTPPRGGSPTSVTVQGPAWADALVADIASQLHAAAWSHAACWRPPPGSPAAVELVVVGLHLRGEPLHHQLVDLGAALVTLTRTAPDYRLVAMAGTPVKPGLVRVPAGTGVAVEVEVHRLTVEAFGRFVADVRGPSCIGPVRLASGAVVPGYLCEPVALEGSVDISAFGGWRAYREAATGG